jgi:uncharacterized protein YgiM (DUF1202 family)
MPERVETSPNLGKSRDKIMKRLSFLFLLVVLNVGLATGQTVIVRRNVNLRSDASTDKDPIASLAPGTKLRLLEPTPVGGYYHVQTVSGQSGFVWGKNVKIQQGTRTSLSLHAESNAGGIRTYPGPSAPSPLLEAGHPVEWWFAFKFNSASFPKCAAGATRTCLFGGQVQSSWTSFSQQFAVVSSDSKTLQPGSGCVGDTTEDPMGATFDEIYSGSYNYVVWNDQFYQDPRLAACGSSNSCSAPWGHSKGMLAWNDSGGGVVMQVTTPDWPGAGGEQHPRQEEGNTLGCTARDNDVLVSRPGDFVNTNSLLRIGIGPTKRFCRFGISLDIFA